MIRASITDGGALDRINARLARLRDLDLAPLAATLAAIIEADGRAAIGAGTSPDGSDFAPLAPSTIRRRGGSTIPGGGPSSTLASGLESAVELTGSGLVVRLGWSGTLAQRAAFFALGTKHQPARPLQGLSPDSWARIQAAVRDFAAGAGRSI